MPAVTPVRCLGCALAQPGRHRCAGKRELSVTGGYCQCPDEGCGPG